MLVAAKHSLKQSHRFQRYDILKTQAIFGTTITPFASIFGSVRML
jgi:hypothetical protein